MCVYMLYLTLWKNIFCLELVRADGNLEICLVLNLSLIIMEIVLSHHWNRVTTVCHNTSLLLFDFPGGSQGKASTCNMEGPGSISRSGKSPGEGNSNPLQYSYLENPMDRGAWQATVHRVTESDTTKAT